MCAYEYQECDDGDKCPPQWSEKNIPDINIPPFRQCPVDALKMYAQLSVTPPMTIDPVCTQAATDIGYHTGYSTREDHDEWDSKKREDEDKARGWLSVSAYDGFMKVLCQNVKKDGNGIRIYTVTLGNEVSDEGKKLMKGCASGDHYYNTENVGDLPATFADIASSLTKLRLIE